MSELDNHMWDLVYHAFENIADHLLFSTDGTDETESRAVDMCHEQMRLLRDVYDLYPERRDTSEGRTPLDELVDLEEGREK